MLPKRALIYWQAWAPADWSERLWGVDAAQALVFFLPDFVATRATSPFVFGPLFAATVVTLAIVFRAPSTRP